MILMDTQGLAGTVSVCQGSASDAKDHFKAVKSIMCHFEFLESYINCFYVPNLQMDISFDENKLCLILIHGL